MATEKDMVEETKEEEEEAEKDGFSAKEKESGGRKHGGGIHGHMPKHGKGPKHHSVHARKKGGHLPLDGAKEHKAHLPHHKARRHGGAVHGEKEEHRPDRRARGGSVTADLHPETAAGRVSMPSYLSQHTAEQDKGTGSDNRGPRLMQASGRD